MEAVADGSVVRRLRLEEAPLGFHRGEIEARLKLVQPLDEDERLAILTDPLGPKIGEEGSIAQRLFERTATMAPEVARAYLEGIYKKVAAPLHLRTVVSGIISELEDRKCNGVGWEDLTDELAIEVPVDGYAITVVDANGYTACLLRGQYHEKVQTAAAITNAFDEIARKTGVVLLEPVVGDAAIFLSFNPEQQAVLEAEVAALKIPMNIRSLRGEKTPDGRDKYPKIQGAKGRHFTLSTGVHPVNKPLVVAAYGGKGNRRGGVVVHGEAREGALALQKHAKAGEVLKHGRYENRVDSSPNYAEAPTPQSDLILMKTIEAILQMTSYSEAAIDSLLEGPLNRELASRLDAYYAVLDLEGGDAHAFWRAFVQEGTGTDHLVLFKPVGARELHFWSRNISSPEQFQAEFEKFVRQMKRLATLAGSALKLGLGHEAALELLHLPNSFQVDATGTVIVRTVRAVAALGRQEGDRLNVDQSACAALGLRAAEFTTEYSIKGQPYVGVHLDLDANGKISMPEPLLGREKELERVHSFIDQIGVNGVSLRVQKPAGTQDSGWGESALLRAAEHYARTQRHFEEDQLIRVQSVEELETELLRKLGFRMEDLIRDPSLVKKPVLLIWDARAVLPMESAQMDSFLSAVAGASIALIHTGDYNFRSEMSLGDRYSGRELSATIELGPLSEDAAVQLIFQTRGDLDPADEARVRQLLAEWGRPFVPRLLIHTFSRALKKIGTNYFLDSQILEQIWDGELAQILDLAGFNDQDRVALGIIAETGLPMSEADLSAIAPGIKWDLVIPGFLKKGLIKVVSDSDETLRYAPASTQIRRARLLARQFRPQIQSYLKENTRLEVDIGAPLDNVEDAMICLEHALDNPEYCAEKNTALMVYRLGRHHSTMERGFGAAYTIYCSYLEALSRHKLKADMIQIPSILAKDLVWAFTQTGHKNDMDRARFVLAALERPAALEDELELMWRERGRMQALLPAQDLAPVLETDDHADILNQVRSYQTYFESMRTSDHLHLDLCMRLAKAFDQAAVDAEVGSGDEAHAKLAFKTAALARRANASRILTRLAIILEKDLPWNRNEVAMDDSPYVVGDVSLAGMAPQWIFSSDLDAAYTQDHYRFLAQNLRGVSCSLISQGTQDLTALEAELALLEGGADSQTDFQKELIGEANRHLADTRKYLYPIPNDDEFKTTQEHYARAEAQLGSLERTLPFAGLDSADVRLNHAALYLERKITHFEMTNRDDDLAQIRNYRQLAEEQLDVAVRHGMLPYRYRLKIQLMNFIELEYRLRKINPSQEEKSILDRLEAEYRDLNQQTAQLHELIYGKRQVDYYSLVFLPLTGRN